MTWSVLFGLFLVTVGLTVTAFTVVEVRKILLLRQQPDKASRSQYIVMGLFWMIWGLPELPSGQSG